MSVKHLFQVSTQVGAEANEDMTHLQRLPWATGKMADVKHGRHKSSTAAITAPPISDGQQAPGLSSLHCSFVYRCLYALTFVGRDSSSDL